MKDLAAAALTAAAAVASPGLAAESRLRPRGSNQVGMRQYNERVVLHAIRLHGPLSGAEIARITNLTAQSVSLITKRLLDDELLRKGAPQRGRVGQPSVPLSLNPDGAFAIGIKVGRRSLDVLLVDLTGQVRHRSSLEYTHANPHEVVPAIAQRLKEARRRVGAERRDRIQGVGIAAPLAMDGWQQLLGLPDAIAQQWRSFDLASEVTCHTDLPVTMVKDTAAACVAELVAGRGRSIKSFLYVFVDTFVGGGLVLGNQLHVGAHGNAGAVGSMSLRRATREQAAPPPQMLSEASLLTLERAYARAGLDVGATTDARAFAEPWRAVTDAWLGEAALALACGLHGAACLLDVDGLLIDGSCDRRLLQALLEAVQQAMGRYDWEGVRVPEVATGIIGSDARAIGAAMLPLYASFAPDREAFLKVQA